VEGVSALAYVCFSLCACLALCAMLLLHGAPVPFPPSRRAGVTAAAEEEPLPTNASHTHTRAQHTQRTQQGQRRTPRKRRDGQARSLRCVHRRGFATWQTDSIPPPRRLRKSARDAAATTQPQRTRPCKRRKRKGSPAVRMGVHMDCAVNRLFAHPAPLLSAAPFRGSPARPLRLPRPCAAYRTFFRRFSVRHTRCGVRTTFFRPRGWS